MTAPRQLPLDLGYRPALDRDDFLVSSSNADAVAWIDRWPAWPSLTLAVFGPPGCGKTHLAKVFAACSGAVAIYAMDLTATVLETLVGGPSPIIIEDGDHISDERAFLHLFNVLREAGRGMLLTGQNPPARWPVKLPDLSSRLRSVTAVGISPPSDEMFSAVLFKLFGDRQLKVDADVVTFLVRRIDRSFEAARRIVAAADTAAMAEGKAVTIPLVRKLTDAGSFSSD